MLMHAKGCLCILCPAETGWPRVSQGFESVNGAVICKLARECKKTRALSMWMKTYVANSGQSDLNEFPPKLITKKVTVIRR